MSRLTPSELPDEDKDEDEGDDLCSQETTDCIM